MRGRDTLVSGALLAVLATGACAPRAAVPDRPQPIPRVDTLPIEEPEAREVDDLVVGLGEATRDEIGHTFSVRRAIEGTEPALNLTAFDEVVASSWYEHRITAPGGMTPGEVAEGPPGEGPEGTLTVVEGKVEGVSPGFTVVDGKGDRYLLKFDPGDYPALSSGADIVTSRLLWAAGYWVPKDVLVTLDPDDLAIDPDAEIEEDGDLRPMTRADVEDALEGVARTPDGRIRTLASRFVDGTPKGRWLWEQTWGDDPNDHYPHEHRRELRGLHVIGSWLNHVDMSKNTLASYIDPPGYVRHYLIDFGTSLGSGGIRVLNPREGREHVLDLWPVLGRFFTLGAYRVGWEGEDGTPIHPSIGWLQVEDFDPAAWKPYWPTETFRRVTPADGYWGAKRVAALDSAYIEAVVEAADYPDPAAADTLADILRLRRERVVEHWFSQVSPVEDVRAEDGSAGGLLLTFRDLGVEHGLRDADEGCYRWRLTGVEGAAADLEGTGSRVCGAESRAPGGSPARRGVRIPLDLDADGQWSAVVELTLARPDGEGRPARIWLRGGPDGVEVVGLRH